MKRFWTELVTPFKKLFQSFRKNRETVKHYKTFEMGDIVQSKDGWVGQIIMVYKDQVTDKPVGCCVKWRGSPKGNDMSIFTPVVDMGRSYNPIIRRLI